MSAVSSFEIYRERLYLEVMSLLGDLPLRNDDEGRAKLSALFTQACLNLDIPGFHVQVISPSAEQMRRGEYGEILLTFKDATEDVIVIDSIGEVE